MCLFSPQKWEMWIPSSLKYLSLWPIILDVTVPSSQQSSFLLYETLLSQLKHWPHTGHQTTFMCCLAHSVWLWHHLVDSPGWHPLHSAHGTPAPLSCLLCGPISFKTDVFRYEWRINERKGMDKEEESWHILTNCNYFFLFFYLILQLNVYFSKLQLDGNKKFWYTIAQTGDCKYQQCSRISKELEERIFENCHHKHVLRFDLNQIKHDTMYTCIETPCYPTNRCDFMSYVPVKNKFNLPHGSAQGDSFQTLCAISNTIIPWSISCVGTQT
jgi:hypothetical protein